MYRDPQIRSYHETPPLVPGSLTRFRWPDYWDPAVRMIRERVQDAGRGLYLLRTPYPGGKVLVEAHYPEDLRQKFVGQQMDPFRQEDVRMGRLVVVNVLDDIKPPDVPLDVEHIREVRRNNRNARRDLRRRSSGSNRRLEMEEHRRQREKPIFDRWSEFYRQVQVDIRKYAATPHVGPARSLSLGG